MLYLCNIAFFFVLSYFFGYIVLFLFYDISFKAIMNSIPKNTEKIGYFIIAILSLFIFTSCNQLDIEQDGRTLEERKRDVRNAEKDINIDSGLTLSDILGIEDESFGFQGSITFQVALDKVSFMPLNSVDSASGIIITDWYNIDKDNLRLKINIRVLNDEIVDNSIDVQIFKQGFDGQKWIDQGSDPEQASKIKKSILDEARTLQATIDLS